MPSAADRSPEAATQEEATAAADAERPLPKSIQLMWGLAQEGSRGPRRGLSLEQIADAAIEIADEDGFAGLSMNKVAERLGFTAMSLYRYVDSKATLVEIALDRVLGTPPGVRPGTPWRETLHQWAWAEYRLLAQHAGWLSVKMGAPPLGPNNMAWLEAGLSALAQTRLPEPLKLQLVMNLSLFVIGRARLIAEIDPGSPESDGDWDILERILDPERFPAVTAAVRAQAFEQDEGAWDDLFFERSLALMLDGYEKLIESYE